MKSSIQTVSQLVEKSFIIDLSGEELIAIWSALMVKRQRDGKPRDKNIDGCTACEWAYPKQDKLEKEIAKLIMEAYNIDYDTFYVQNVESLLNLIARNGFKIDREGLSYIAKV